MKSKDRDLPRATVTENHQRLITKSLVLNNPRVSLVENTDNSQQFLTLPDFKSVLSRASAWGFACKSEDDGNCQILPQQQNQRWKLQSKEDRWLLLVGDVPQISLHPDEAIAFLQRRFFL